MIAVGLAMDAFAVFLAVDLGSPVTLSEPLKHEAVTISVGDSIREAQEKNPEVQAAEAEVRAALGRYLPEISATWMYDWQRARNRGETFSSPDGYSAGGGAHHPALRRVHAGERGGNGSGEA